MRVYLVVVDDSPESGIALRFAARRAVRTGGGVEILALIAPQAEIMPFGGVQATLEDEARQRAERLVASAAGTLFQESGVTPSITVREGEGPAVVREIITANPAIAALVLGAAEGSPGPLVTHFATGVGGSLPVPLMIIPGNLDRAALDRLS